MQSLSQTGAQQVEGLAASPTLVVDEFEEFIAVPVAPGSWKSAQQQTVAGHVAEPCAG
jgi:hypothetical protein